MIQCCCDKSLFFRGGLCAILFGDVIRALFMFAYDTTPRTVLGGGDGVSRDAERVCLLAVPLQLRVHLLRRESSTCGRVGLLPTHWVGAEDGRFRKLQEVGTLLGYAAG